MDLGIKGKVAMVAAGSKGLGYGIARALAAEGAKLCIGSRSAEHLDKARKELETTYQTEVMTACFDASQPESILHWRDVTLDAFGGVDMLLVNAGGPPAGGFDDFTDEDWQKAFDLTLMSSVRMIRAVLPSMRARGGGSILVLTSSSVKEPIDILLLSNVMRSGVTSLAKSLSKELAKDKIRVNNLVPGRIHTERLDHLDKINAGKKGISVEEQRQWEFNQIPAGRYGHPDEFGRAGAFLLSSASSYISGATLIVDGGSMKTVW